MGWRPDITRRWFGAAVLVLLGLAGCTSSSGGDEDSNGARTSAVEAEGGGSEDGASEDGGSEDGASEDGASEDGASDGGASEDGASENGVVDPETIVDPAPAPAYFETLPPGSSLPSSASCATWIRPVPENVPENGPFNQTRGERVEGATYISQGGGLTPNDLELRINGDFVGSTDEIIQWAACKWGFDEDLVRAQAYTESSWYAGRLGDCGENTHERTGGEGGCSSYGLIQVRGAELEGTFHPGVYPSALESSAMNLDYALAIKRLCFEGFEEWLADFAFNEEGYTAGDEWGCMGRWFSGNFRDELALDYIAAVETNLAERNWETEFVGCSDWRETFYCSGLDLPVFE